MLRILATLATLALLVGPGVREAAAATAADGDSTTAPSPARPRIRASAPT